MDKRIYIVGGLLLLGGAALFFSRYAMEQAEKENADQRIVLEDDRRPKKTVPRALQPKATNLKERGSPLDVDGAKAHIAAAKRLRDERAGAGDASRLMALTRAYARLEAARRAAPPEKQTFSADREGITSAMKATKPALRACYEPWAKQNPKLAGKITAQYVIGANGGPPAKAKIEAGGLGSALLDGCVLSVVREELHFEAPESGEEIVVNYPLTFINTSSDAHPETE